MAQSNALKEPLCEKPTLVGEPPQPSMLGKVSNKCCGEGPLDWKIKVAGGCGCCWLTVFLVVAFIQYCIWFYATIYCSERYMKDYTYGDTMESDPFNIVAPFTELTERDERTLEIHTFAPGEVKPKGRDALYYRYWGPLFTTHIVQDINAYGLFYVRDKMIQVGSAHSIYRCDGGPKYEFTTFGHIWGNWFSTIVGMETTSVYNIKLDGKVIGQARRGGKVAVGKEAGYKENSGVQLTFTNGTTNQKLGAAFPDPVYHGWQVKAEDDKNPDGIPAYVMNSIGALMMYAQTAAKRRATEKADQARDTGTPPKSFLADVEVPFLSSGVTRQRSGDKEAGPLAPAAEGAPAAAAAAAESAAAQAAPKAVAEGSRVDG